MGKQAPITDNFWSTGLTLHAPSRIMALIIFFHYAKRGIFPSSITRNLECYIHARTNNEKWMLRHVWQLCKWTLTHHYQNYTEPLRMRKIFLFVASTLIKYVHTKAANRYRRFPRRGLESVYYGVFTRAANDMLYLMWTWVTWVPNSQCYMILGHPLKLRSHVRRKPMVLPSI